MNYYWHLRNPDPGMSKFAKWRVDPYVKKFEEMIEQASKGAYRGPTLDKTDQRLDFEINIWREVRKLAAVKFTRLTKDADRRRRLETGKPDPDQDADIEATE